LNVDSKISRKGAIEDLTRCRGETLEEEKDAFEKLEKNKKNVKRRYIEKTPLAKKKIY